MQQSEQRFGEHARRHDFSVTDSWCS